jgi:hypothetical protein
MPCTRAVCALMRLQHVVTLPLIEAVSDSPCRQQREYPIAVRSHAAPPAGNKRKYVNVRYESFVTTRTPNHATRLTGRATHTARSRRYGSSNSDTISLATSDGLGIGLWTTTCLPVIFARAQVSSTHDQTSSTVRRERSRGSQGALSSRNVLLHSIATQPTMHREHTYKRRRQMLLRAPADRPAAERQGK